MATGGTTGATKTFQKLGQSDGQSTETSVVCTRACVLRRRGGMRRSGALTLGVVLTLGGVTGGRGQEPSGSVTAPTLGGFVLPTIPENWADLPFRLTASQEVTFNSNINAIPLGSPVPPREVRGDFTSTTNFGFSTKANVSGQELYLDTTFGLIRYLHQVGSDSTVYSVSAGDNWTLTSRCAGNLGVTLSKSPGTLGTTLVGTGINYTKSTAFNETGKCAVSNGYSLLFNTGWTGLTNSTPLQFDP